MLKELVKMASELDRLGLNKEADTIDEIIKRFAGRRGERRDLFQECECFMCGVNVVVPIGGGCICQKCKPIRDRKILEEKIDRCKEFLEFDAPERMERLEGSLKRAVNSGDATLEESVRGKLEELSTKIEIKERELEEAELELNSLLE